MRKGSNSREGISTSHHHYKDRAKNRVDDLQGMFSNLQSARKESRTVDVALLEEQVHQMLREWKAELNEPSPATSLQQGGSLGSFSSEICRLLQLCEEADDATSVLTAPKPEPNGPKDVNGSTYVERFPLSKGLQEQDFPLVDQCKSSIAGATNIGMDNKALATQLDYNAFNSHQEFEQQFFLGIDDTKYVVEESTDKISGYQQNVFPPPSAFLGPKCALWDCTRPALGRNWSHKSDDYCSAYHSGLAPSEGYLGSPPVVRPGGIGLKDNLLFSALSSKAQGKDVGIPECEGAATAKSPWNAPELFDLSLVDGETIREWLFFDKPRRAFESGNRKQRSLPDYVGRGWHESRKQVMNEFGGLKRSYYMDPQPMTSFEWHLYEYELNKYDEFALYRLEVKCADRKKAPKGKLSKASVANLQKKMGRLTAEFPNNKQRNGKGRGKGNLPKDGSGTNHSASNLPVGAGEMCDDDYLVDNHDEYYQT
ncbi:transcription factor VOZ1-like isoform X2 [Andrographis paniculata]|uniref:transcription factor VOZ1-like isoform X2 n=1 Tax=Andrographis paniculata TaxID=175694 RepID=UPI0021E91512|nr:transcription factor VOZ1-like isoform X2 [Andrographis paniculata]